MVIARILMLLLAILAALIIVYLLYVMIKDFFQTVTETEDRWYRIRKFFHTGATIVGDKAEVYVDRTFRKYGSGGRGKEIALGSAIALANKTVLPNADPAIKIRAEIDALITKTLLMIDEAEQNALDYGSQDALDYIIECKDEVMIIANSMDDCLENIAVTKKRLNEIYFQMKEIAEATAFDDADPAASTGSAGTASSSAPAVKNYYDILGVDQDANQDEIKKAFRELCQIFHPDRLESFAPDAKKKGEEKFKDINEAYSVLSDKTKRKDYDSTIS